LQEILQICWTIKEISLELREVSISMSKSQQWVCFNDTHRQCDDSSILIALLISESIRLLIHVQLVSLLQWHDNVFNNKQIFELVSILKSSVSLLQWHRQCNDLLITLSISESIRLSIHVQLVSLLQWHLFSMRWSTRFHRSTHQWIWSYVHVQLVSLLQWHLSSMQWSIYSHRSIYQWIDSSISSRATSESATMTSSKSISSMSKSISESASMTSVNSWSLRWASRFSSSESASMTSVNSWSLRWASQFFST